MGMRQTLAAQWLDHVQRWRTSGLSRAAYCSREALSLSAFCYWISKSNRQRESSSGPALTLVAARAQWLPSAQEEVQALTLRTPEGWQLSFAHCPPASWLREVLGAVER